MGDGGRAEVVREARARLQRVTRSFDDERCRRAEVGSGEAVAVNPVELMVIRW